MNSLLATAAEDQDSLNRKARERALSLIADHRVDVTGLVDYRSTGRLLVVGEDLGLIGTALGGASPLRASVLIIAGGRQAAPDVTSWSAPREAVTLQGWLGDFRLGLAHEGQGEAHFDLVLDLCAPPLIGSELKPPGYLAPGPDPAALDAALTQLRDLVGDFEKPRYLGYDPDICAHGMKGATACRRCIDACPADAITSLVDRVRVEPHLCQGGGACATACPSGAMTYRYPGVEDALERMRRMLFAYGDSGGEAPVVLIQDTDSGARQVERLLAGTQGTSGHLLAFAVEEVASLGMEAWLSALAYGARAVRLVATPALTESPRRELDAQLSFARAILDAMGYPADALGWLQDGPGSAAPVMPAIEPARYAALGGKRQILFAALDHLQGQAPSGRTLVELPAGAPFGTAVVDEKACTLCMACVTVCPGKALQDGQSVPQLKFREANCVQCGLCTRCCPEDAIWISPRLLFDAQARNQVRLLREDTPFHCVSCGAAFATTAVIGRMQQRLSGHSMFQDPGALSRLRMCGDCRVADMMQKQEI